MEEEEQANVDKQGKKWKRCPGPKEILLQKALLQDTMLNLILNSIVGLRRSSGNSPGPLNDGELSIEFSNAPSSSTYSRAIQNAMVKLAEMHSENIVFMGEDMEIAGAFGMNIPLKAKGHSSKLLDMPLSESIIINSATGAALGGMKPVAEIQFGGFAALAMNALVNNAAQLRWRWGADVPLTVRIPLGAKTRVVLFMQI